MLAPLLVFVLALDASTGGGAAAHQSPAPQEELARHLDTLHRELHQVGQLHEAGELDAARTQLASIVEGETLAALLAQDGVDGVDLLDQLYDAADVIDALQLQKVVCEKKLGWVAVRRSVDHPDLLEAKGDLCHVLLVLGELERGHELAREVYAVRARRLAPEDPILLLSELRLALALEQLGDAEGALERESRLYARCELVLPEDDELRLTSAAMLAGTLLRLGENARADELYRQVYEVRRRTLPAGHHDLVATKTNLASSRFALGDVAGAQRLLEEACATYEARLPADHPTLLNVKDNLAVARNTLGDAAGALELLEEVHEGRERTLSPDHPSLLTSKRNLAVTSLALGDVHRAYALFDHVHEARERLLHADHPDLLTAKSDLAVVHNMFGDHAGAYELEQEVHASSERLLPPDHPDLLLIKGNLAATLKVRGEFEQALELEEHVHAARVRLLPPDHHELLTAKINLADTRLHLGDRAGARELAAGILRGLDARISSLLLEPPRRARAGALAELERISSCLHMTGESGLDAEILASLESLRAVSVGSTESMRAASQHPELIALYEELFRVRGELGDRAMSPPRTPGVSSEESAVEAWRRSVLALAEERDTLERKLRTKVAETGAVETTPTARRMAAGLSDDAVLVSFFRYTQFSRRAEPLWKSPPAVQSLVAFVMTPDAKVRRVKLGPVREIERLVTKWRNALGAPLRRGSGAGGDRGGDLRGLSPEAEHEGALRERAQGRELRASLLDPCLAVLEGTPARLHVIPDDLVHLVPIDALPWEGEHDDARLGDALSVHVETTAQRLAGGASGGTPLEGGTFVALGGAAFDGETGRAVETESAEPDHRLQEGVDRGEVYRHLPGSRLEVENLGRRYTELLGGEALVLVQDGASKAALVQHASRARYLHIATHGWFASETLASSIDMMELDGVSFTDVTRFEDTVRGFAPQVLCGLVLAGANLGADSHGRVPGILTAEELAGVDLSNCELAVLSACETNVGIRRAGQGIQSLQNALHSAGARTAVTSLWRVDDVLARELMELFYSGIWDDGLGKAEALWRAKCVLRERGEAVRHWAAWVLSGAPD